MKKILFFASLFFAISCSQKNTDSLLVDNEKRILEEIKQQPEITAKIVEQIPFKKMEVAATFGTNANSTVTRYNYDIEYFANGKIKTVQSNNNEIVSIDYSLNQVAVNQSGTTNNYELGSDNLVKNIINGVDKFYYKNGYLSRTNSNSNPFIKN